VTGSSEVPIEHGQRSARLKPPAMAALIGDERPGELDGDFCDAADRPPQAAYRDP